MRRPIKEVRQACLAARRLADKYDDEAHMTRDPDEEDAIRHDARLMRAVHESLNWVLGVEQKCEIMSGVEFNILGDSPEDRDTKQGAQDG